MNVLLKSELVCETRRERAGLFTAAREGLRTAIGVRRALEILTRFDALSIV